MRTSARLAAGGERVALHPAEPDEIGAGGHRLDDVGAARHAAVDDDLRLAVDHVDDLRQHVHRAAAVVELAAAVIGDVDPGDAVIERDPGILGGGDALEHQRNVELLPDALDGAPVERRLELAAGRAPAAGHDMALGEVALAPAVDRGVDGEAEGDIFIGDGAGDEIVDPGLVAADIELEDPRRVGRRLPRPFPGRVRRPS